MNYQPLLSTVLSVEVFLFVRISDKNAEILSESSVSGKNNFHPFQTLKAQHSCRPASERA